MAEKPLSRRDFLKNLGLFVGSLFVPKWSEKILQPEGLPTKETTDYSWEKKEPAEKPPGAYRSAMTYYRELGGYVLHGGWTGNGNHNETWLYKNNCWTKIEQGSTSGLHGHKLVDTPLGVVMYGGLESSEGGNFTTANKIYLMKTDNNTLAWEPLLPDIETNNGQVPAFQGCGMVYNPDTNSVWIIAGGTGTPVNLSDVTYELFLPNAWPGNENWFLRGMGYEGITNIDPVFEPLAFVGADGKTRLYGGVGYDHGGGAGVNSNRMYILENVNANIRVREDDAPVVDYGGGLRGGFYKDHLILTAGKPSTFLGQPYRESVELKNDSWSTVVSADSPVYMGYPAVALDPDGKMLRFGGSYYDTNRTPVWSDETWILHPRQKVFLPVVEKN